MTRPLLLATTLLVACGVDKEDPQDTSAGTDGDTDGAADTDTSSDGDTDGECTDDDALSFDDIGCSQSRDDNEVSITVAAGVRTVATNGVPDHTFEDQIHTVEALDLTYTVSAAPTKASSITGLTDGGRPRWRFGVGLNGVALDPAPAEPFIFETEDGSYNWDWMFEPTNNLGPVSLDCNVAHVQPGGLYHYHGHLAGLAEALSPGITTGTAPAAPVHVGWAADGFPILYRYGPDGSGVVERTPGYALRSGERPGDGRSAPCGTYNGKYTNDYEWSAETGDLDACNGMDGEVSVAGETFSYYYVVTEAFPVIPRCLVGTPDASFGLGPG